MRPKALHNLIMRTYCHKTASNYVPINVGICVCSTGKWRTSYKREIENVLPSGSLLYFIKLRISIPYLLLISWETYLEQRISNKTIELVFVLRIIHKVYSPVSQISTLTGPSHYYHHFPRHKFYTQKAKQSRYRKVPGS